MSKVSITNYVGKKVYVGIDVHKKSYHITAYCDGIREKKATVKANPEEFTKSLKKWFEGAEIFSVYEAGFSGYVLHRILDANGIKNLVINPASIEVAANDRVKTDSRDSEKLAQQLSFGKFKDGKIPSIEEEFSRLSQRTRAQFVVKRVQAGNQIKSKLTLFGYINPDDDSAISELYLKNIEKKELPVELKFVIDLLIKEWRGLTEIIKSLENQIKLDNSKNEIIKKIESVPGIGSLSANILFTELGDMSQFSNKDKLFAFLGLTPSEYSSGETIRKGRITRQGSSRLRQILVEIAWRNIRQDEISREAYMRISATRGGKRAIVACARKLIGRIRAMIASGTEFQYKLTTTI